jgi:RNA polymerase sigma-70 factor (ECF subfamily)
MAPATDVELWRAFRSELAAVDGLDAIEAAFQRFVERARAAPIGLEPTIELAKHMATVVRDATDVVSAVDALHAEDLLLACACADGDRAALAAFERQHVVPLKTVLRGVGLAPHAIDDVLQQVRQWLFVGDERGPRITDFSGRGTLRAWLRVIAVRTARRARARDHRETSDDGVVELPAGTHVELDYLKHAYREEFSVAFREAVQALPVRERNLLRLHLLDNLSIDQIAAIYHVHRSTAARRIELAREAVVTGVRDRFAARIDIDKADLESILDLIASRVDVSLRTVFRPSARSITRT